MTWLISDEARKHRAFREVWVAYLLGGLYLLLGLYTEISEQNYSVLYDAQQKWNFVQQNIYSYGATLTAFLLAVGLPRLVCCEREYRTDDLVGTQRLADCAHGERKRRLQSSIARSLFSSSGQPVCW